MSMLGDLVGDAFALVRVLCSELLQLSPTSTSSATHPEACGDANEIRDFLACGAASNNLIDEVGEDHINSPAICGRRVEVVHSGVCTFHRCRGRPAAAIHPTGDLKDLQVAEEKGGRRRNSCRTLRTPEQI
jgi:hypothetical protein